MLNVSESAALFLESFNKNLFDGETTGFEELHSFSGDCHMVGKLQIICIDVTKGKDPPYDTDASTYAHCDGNAVIFRGVLYGDGSRNANGMMKDIILIQWQTMQKYLLMQFMNLANKRKVVNR